jgi:hypothetical protein
LIKAADLKYDDAMRRIRNNPFINLYLNDKREYEKKLFLLTRLSSLDIGSLIYDDIIKYLR